ncbi:hypothetical protein M8J75_016404 [Diaphorina citri]|nr:hypothetical protein M8J75_016404 [Diaphorina citri]KAI5739992.1 hypothetical protein M8J77_025991 [Diaphorina citri]
MSLKFPESDGKTKPTKYYLAHYTSNIRALFDTSKEMTKAERVFPMVNFTGYMPLQISNQEIETEETIMDEKLEKIYQEANATLNQMVQNSGELATGDQQPSVMNKVLR